ncbi:hypothetical protein MJD09_03690, partial [bacterium]|nr:hypothetical protein [bacterium]
AWREALMCGPTPSTDSEKEWIAIRAQHLHEAYQQSLVKSQTALTQQASKLQACTKQREITLWFEFDLFCQINLTYLLNWFVHQASHKMELYLVCIDSFPGIDNFKGLGQLSPQQLTGLFDGRSRVTRTDLKNAAQAWTAYTSSDPTAIEEFCRSEAARFSFLEHALRAHLERFPSVRNGLGRIENRILELIASGIDEMRPLFNMFGELERDYGLGDLQFQNHLLRLKNVVRPLVEISGLETSENAISWTQACFKVTELGKTVLSGAEDFVKLNGIDYWLGGTHLCGSESLWRWDEQDQQLVEA